MTAIPREILEFVIPFLGTSNPARPIISAKNDEEVFMTPLCPKCDSENVTPIIYGHPSNEIMRQVKRREVVLGGFVMRRNSPDYVCQDCGTKWAERAAENQRTGSQSDPYFSWAMEKSP